MKKVIYNKPWKKSLSLQSSLMSYKIKGEKETCRIRLSKGKKCIVNQRKKFLILMDKWK